MGASFRTNESSMVEPKKCEIRSKTNSCSLLLTPQQWHEKFRENMKNLTEAQLSKTLNYPMLLKVDAFNLLYKVELESKYDVNPHTLLQLLISMIKRFANVSIDKGMNLQVVYMDWVTVPDEALMLSGVHLILSQGSTSVYYAEFNKDMESLLYSVSNLFKFLVNLYKNRIHNEPEVVLKECEKLSLEVESFLNKLRKDTYLVRFFFGLEHNKLYHKMQITEKFDDFAPKGRGAKKCSECKAVKFTPQHDFCVLDACKHVLCLACARVWFAEERRNRCPKCRAEVITYASRNTFIHFKYHQRNFRAFHEEKKRQILESKASFK